MASCTVMEGGGSQTHLLSVQVGVCRTLWITTYITTLEPGCNESLVDQITNGWADKKAGGAIFSFHCDEGSVLQGSHLIFCDGKKWNDSAPVCLSEYLQVV